MRRNLETNWNRKKIRVSLYINKVCVFNPKNFIYLVSEQCIEWGKKGASYRLKTEERRNLDKVITELHQIAQTACNTYLTYVSVCV